MTTPHRHLMVAILGALACATAQAQSGHSPAHHAATHAAGTPAEVPVPTAAGQAAFGAIQEVVRLLEADPDTDWTRVDIDALREHLVDMDEVTLRARTSRAEVDGGLRITVTGVGRTLEAIRRMVPAHARELDARHGWSVVASMRPDGVELVVTAADPVQVARIRGLGFMGLMVQGSHHRPHHLAIARGQRPH